jgi:hypothetical protein
MTRRPAPLFTGRGADTKPSRLILSLNLGITGLSIVLHRLRAVSPRRLSLSGVTIRRGKSSPT